MAQLIGYPGAVVGSTDDVHSTQQNPLGTRAFDGLGNEYVYLKGVASVVQGAWVAIDVGRDGIVAGLDTDVAGTLKSRVAVAMAAVVADKYGWFCIYTGPLGVAGLSAASATDAKAVVATSTVFVVDDAEGGAEILVNGAFYVGAVDTPASGQAYFVLNYPYIHALTLD
jgi:hypothetical protein